MKTPLKSLMLLAALSGIALSAANQTQRFERQQAFVPPKSKNSQKKQRRKARRK